ncbi:MAG TPA: RES family NAD+ phosphorylase [Longimicrobium sp.]|jgi:hypothetical protein
MLYRIHRTSLGTMHFGRTLDPDERQRWDSPDASYGVWYAGEPDYVAFAETLLRDLTLTSISHDALISRSIAEVRVRRDLTVANFADAGLFKLGADSSAADADYQVTWAWSAAIHSHPQGVDGIRYRARHDNSGISYAFFDRVADAFDPGPSVPLLSPQNAVRLGAWLDRYGLGLGS